MYSQQSLHLDNLYGDVNFLDLPAVTQGKSYTFSARIVADPDGKYDGYLIVKVELAPNWYIYSNTQPSGGPIPTKIEAAANETFQLADGFAASSPPKSERNDVFEMIIEKHFGTVSWVAPFRLTGDIPLASLKIEGKINAQVCDENACVPVMEPFQAVFSAEDAVAEINGAKKVAVSPQTTPVKPAAAFNPDNLEGEEVVKVQGIGLALMYAFLGGLILNVMPCVLPVIGLKILSFFNQAGKNRLRAFLLNVWYTLGLLTVFLVLAFLSIGLSTMFTYSVFGIVMCCVVFAMSLSLMDVWELRTPFFLGSGKSAEMMQQEGAVGAYFKGIITTLLAIPCGAPLLSPALAWADLQVKNGASANVCLVYLFIGIGMAFPFLLVGAFPELLRFIPKPGQWMETFKKTMGFLLLTAVVWILYFIPLETILPTVALIFAIWFGCWFIGRLSIIAPVRQRLFAWTVSLAVFSLILILAFPVIPNNPYTLQNAMEIKLARLTGNADTPHWTPFRMEKLESELAAGKTVIVDFTADWCLSCKELENRVLHNHDVLQQIDALQIVTLQADWTNSDPMITSLLEKLGGTQVPVVAIFRAEAPNQPIILRGSFTTKMFLTYLSHLESKNPSVE
ncbi:MAG: thioredoxin family protein [Planctomycetaceae bacterium]|nr:thioredoxin family protein [Planctomycetaceae bacterium]